MGETLAEMLARKCREGPRRGAAPQDEVEVLAPPPAPGRGPQPEHVQARDVPRFSPDDYEGYKAHLEEHGFVVISGVLEEAEVEHATGLFWDFLEQYGMRREDPLTWGDENFSKIGSVGSGIVAGGGFGQSSFQWFCRTRQRVKSVFSHLYGTDNLITSFDGGNIFRPWQSNGYESRCTSGGWMHVDQGRLLRGLQCIQGIVTLTNVNEETGGFCCIPSSHRHHDELVDRHATNDDNFLKVPSDFHCLSNTQLMPKCNAGDLILWESRTFHCSSPAIAFPSKSMSELLRMASYICMVPASKATPDIIQKRIDMYVCNTTGTHWPHILNFKKKSSDCVVNDLTSLSNDAEMLLTGGQTTDPH